MSTSSMTTYERWILIIGMSIGFMIGVIVMAAIWSMNA